DLTGLAAAAEDDRWPRDTVVVVGERIAVGAGRRRDEDVAGGGLGQGNVTNEHVAGLTVLAGDMAALGAGRERTVSDDRLIRRVVEHRPEVVRHTAIDGDPGRRSEERRV